MPFILLQLTFYSLWISIKNESSSSEPSAPGLNFIWPEIGPTRFHSQWPFTETQLYSLAWCFQNSFLSLPNGSTAEGNLINFLSNTQENSLKLNFINGGGLIKVAPLSSAFLFLIGPSTISVKYTSTFSKVGQTNEATLLKALALTEVHQQLDPVRPTVISLSNLVSFVTLESLSFGQASLWSDAHSMPTFGSYRIAPYLEFHNSFFLNITPLNNTFQIIEQTLPTQSTSYLVTLPLGPIKLLSQFVEALQTAISAVYANLTVNVLSFDTNVSQLVWTSLEERLKVKVDDTKNVQSQCATAAMLGLYTSGSSGGVIDLEVFPGPTDQSKSPGATVVQWPVANQIQRLANPGSADTDGALRFSLTNTRPLESSMPNQPPDLILQASNLIYRFIGPKANIIVNSFLSYGSILNESVEVELRIQALSETYQEILGLYIRPNNLNLFSNLHASIAINGSTLKYVSGEPSLTADTLSYTLSPQSFTSLNVLEDINLQLCFHIDPEQSLNDDFNEAVEISATISSRIVWQPFGYETQRLHAGDTDLGLFAPLSSGTQKYCSLEAWAGGGASILGSSVPWRGGASSRLQMTLMLENNAIETMEARVGTKGLRTHDLYGQGGQCTFLSINNIKLFVLGSGGSAAMGSHGGQGGGPIGQPFLNDLTTDSVLRYPGFSGSSANFQILNNPQTLGPTQKPLIDSLQYETWQGSGGYNVRGQDGFFVAPSRPCALGGIGAYDLKVNEFVVGGRGTSASAFNGGGGGGPSAIQNVSNVSLDLSIISVNVNGPWQKKSDDKPLGGGFGPYNANNNNSNDDDFVQVMYVCDTVSLLQLISEVLWNRAKQLSWTRKILKHLATKLFVSGILAERLLNSWTVRDTFMAGQADVSYAALGPCDTFLPDVGGPNASPMNSGEQVLFDDNNTICILNQGQIQESIELYLNTLFSGPGVPEGTIVQAIRIGPSKPLGLYASSIYLSLSNTISDIEGPFTWQVPKSSSFLIGPPIFNQGTLIHSQGLKASESNNSTINSQFDQTLNDFDIIELQELVNAIYEIMTYTNFALDSNVQENALPSDTVNGPSYLQALWPSEQQTIRVFIRPEVLASIEGPRNFTVQLNFGDDTEIVVPLGIQTVKMYAFGAGGSSLNIYKGLDGQFAHVALKGLAGQTLMCRIGQGGGTGLPQGSHGGLNDLTGHVIGGGATFVTTSSNRPLVYAGGGGSGGLNESKNKLYKFTNNFEASNSTIGNPGGSGFLWGHAGLHNCAGSSGSSYGPSGFLSTNLSRQKYYSNTCSYASNLNNEAGHGKLVIEFIY